MPNRVTTYKEAFEGVLGMKFDEKLKEFIKKKEAEGHTEKSICFTIWKMQHKLCVFKGDSRFLSVLNNEIEKWSWKKDDPRWDEYWKRKKEAEKAEKMRNEIYACKVEDDELKRMDKWASHPPKNKKGFVYFIQGLCGGAIKVGYSADPKKRLLELQTGYPDTLTILLMIPGDERTERTLHRLFEASRLKGEWFRPDDYIMDKIKELKVKYGVGNKEDKA